VSGMDIVAEQLRIADGQVLSRTGRIAPNGHAIECRVNAEDPAFDFRPAAGRLGTFHLAAGPGVRVDTFCRSGGYVPPYYDSLIAKLCVWAPDRPRAVARMRRALGESVVEGVPTTLPLLEEISQEEVFISGRYTTSYLVERAAHLPSLGGGGGR